MVHATSKQPKVCFTTVGVLIYDNRILLIKHKKLNFWLNPGGHIEAGELPHEAAEREFWEETGIKVKAFDPDDSWWSKEPGYEHLPNPFGSNLHWISEANYQARINGEPVTGKGCEKHLSFIYLVQPVEGVEFKQNEEETLGIGWFTEAEALAIVTRDNIRLEIKKAFSLIRKTHHV